MVAISVKKIKILILILALLIALSLGLTIFSVVRKNRKRERLEVPTLEMAPENIYRSRNVIKLSSLGSSFYIDDNGNIIITDKNGNRYIIDKDGKIYLLNEDGSLSENLTDSQRRELAESMAEIKSKYFQNDKSLQKAIEANEGAIYEFLIDAAKSATVKETEGKTEEKEGILPKRTVPKFTFPSETDASVSNPSSSPTNTLGGLQQSQSTSNQNTLDGMAVVSPNSDFISLDTSALSSQFAEMNKTEYQKQNMQDSKRAFIEGYQNINSEGDFLTTYDIAPGTIISLTLLTGINSDLPGMVIAQTNYDIYDSISGKNLLLAKGTKLIANYDSAISYGQERILIAWTYLSRSDGYSCSVPGFQGVDNLGRSGYNGKVNNHFWNVAKSAMLSSLIDLPSIALTRLTKSETIQDMLESIAESTSTAGKEIIEKNINRQPTITIEPGTTCKLIVNKTLSLPKQER